MADINTRVAERATERAAFLARSELALGERSALGLAAALTTVRVARGEYLFLQGSPTDRFMIVEFGAVAVQAISPSGRELVFTLKRPGDTIGEAAIIDGSPRTASVVGHTDATLLSVGRRRFLELAMADAELALALAAVTARSLRRESSRVERRTFADLAERLAIHLVGDSPDPVSGPITVSATQQALADRMGVTRESVNKTLRRWSARGLVVVERGRVVVPNPARLLDRARPSS